MTTHSKIVIACGALIVAMVAGRTAAPSAAEPNAAVQGVWRTLEVGRASCRERVCELV